MGRAIGQAINMNDLYSAKKKISPGALLFSIHWFEQHWAVKPVSHTFGFQTKSYFKKQTNLLLYQWKDTEELV